MLLHCESLRLRLWIYRESSVLYSIFLDSRLTDDSSSVTQRSDTDKVISSVLKNHEETACILIHTSGIEVRLVKGILTREMWSAMVRRATVCVLYVLLVYCDVIVLSQKLRMYDSLQNGYRPASVVDTR